MPDPIFAPKSAPTIWRAIPGKGVRLGPHWAPAAFGPAPPRPAADKREGDNATPLGTFALRRVLWRADRLPAPETALPLSPLAPEDLWCDDPHSHQYNRPVKAPFAASAEHLWRADHVYDVIVVIGHNDDPVVPFFGSAIFMHLAKPDFAPTQGCVAMTLGDMLEFLRSAHPGDYIAIQSDPLPE